jgi:hypothetical protein
VPLILKGVMQSPVTPLKADFSPDLETFERLLDFHVRTGATAISWPHHKGESLNLTIAERKRFAEVAVKTVAGRVPVSIHVSALAVEDSIDLARHAQAIGADAIIAITPYFWNPSPQAIHDWFMRLGSEVDLPIIAYNSPSYLDGVEFTDGTIEVDLAGEPKRRRVRRKVAKDQSGAESIPEAEPAAEPAVLDVTPEEAAADLEATPEPIAAAVAEPKLAPQPEVDVAALIAEDPNQIVAPPEKPKRGWWRR